MTIALAVDIQRMSRKVSIIRALSDVETLGSISMRSSTQSAFSWNLLKNPWLIGGLIFGMILQFSIIYLPKLGAFFHTRPIEAKQLFQIIALSSIVLWSKEIRKFILRSSKARPEFQSP